MTPTLIGRWQTRILLLSTIGLFVSIPFVLVLNSFLPFIFVGLVLLFGMGWDSIYQLLIQDRWDHDWPPLFQLLAGLAEGLWLFLLVYFWPQFADPPQIWVFWLHYGLVWTTTFIASQSLLRLIFPRWRFRGGQWVGGR